MYLIGMIFDDEIALRASFFQQAFGLTNDSFSKDATVVNCGRRNIKSYDTEWEYVLIENDEDLNKISGLQFDSIYSELKNSKHKQWVMTRFRPRLNK